MLSTSPRVKAFACSVVRPTQLRTARAAVAHAKKQTTDASTEQIYEQTEKVVADLKNKWDKTEEKPAAIGLAVAGFVALYVANGVVNALDNIPIISGVLELVGIFVTSWFVYRYLVFGPDREQLKQNINSFLKKVSGKSSTTI